jgi:hypothetical protein
MTDTARALLADPRAPADERYDAQMELQKASTSGGLAAALMPNKDVAEVVDYIRNDLEEQSFIKSISAPRIVQFPAKNAGRPGMQSVYLDDMQISWQGAYFDKPGTLNFSTLRAMADGTPLIASIIMTRVRQVMRFCAPQEAGEGPGFAIRHVEKDHALSDAESESIQLLTKFIQNCGWEWNPRQRRRLKRDDFPTFMAKSVRDTLIMDNAPIETEMKRERALGIDGFYAVDGATVYLVNELDYKGEDEIFACQVVNGQIRAAYSYDDLILVPRNPTSNILNGGYGMSELEFLVKIVTGFLNALEINLSGMSKNSIPRGFMTLVGNYGEQDLAAFKRYWSATVKGANNRFNMPVMVSKDSESKAEFHEIGNQVDEVMYQKWMELLGAMACAVYSIAPEEINWTSYSASKSSLSGNDTTEKLAQSMDKGLRPLLSYYQNMFSDYVLSEFSDKYVFRFVGLDEEDQQQRFEARKIAQTWNEFRAGEGLDAIDGPMGDAPMNPSFIGPWMQAEGIGQQQPEQGGEQEDFGTPPDEDQGQDAGDEQGDPGDADQDDADAGGDDAGEGDPAGDKPDFGKPQELDFGKSFADAERFGLPVISIWGDQ